MSHMFEVYCGLPVDISREARIEAIVKSFDGQLTYREGPADEHDSKYVCLTFEFRDVAKAEEASRQLLKAGEHVEGIQVYGD